MRTSECVSVLPSLDHKTTAKKGVLSTSTAYRLVNRCQQTEENKKSITKKGKKKRIQCSWQRERLLNFNIVSPSQPQSASSPSSCRRRYVASPFKINVRQSFLFFCHSHYVFSPHFIRFCASILNATSACLTIPEYSFREIKC